MNSLRGNLSEIDKNLHPGASLINQKSKEGLQCNVAEETRCRAGINGLGNLAVL
jgi:hypothetical protein